MVFVTICLGCEGKGYIEVLNAYDPKEVLEVPCDDCDGVGVVESVAEEKSRRSNKKNPDDWDN